MLDLVFLTSNLAITDRDPQDDDILFGSSSSQSMLASDIGCGLFRYNIYGISTLGTLILADV